MNGPSGTAPGVRLVDGLTSDHGINDVTGGTAAIFHASTAPRSGIGGWWLIRPPGVPRGCGGEPEDDSRHSGRGAGRPGRSWIIDYIMMWLVIQDH